MYRYDSLRSDPRTRRLLRNLLPTTIARYGRLTVGDRYRPCPSLAIVTMCMEQGPNSGLKVVRMLRVLHVKRSTVEETCLLSSGLPVLTHHQVCEHVQQPREDKKTVIRVSLVRLLLLARNYFEASPRFIAATLHCEIDYGHAQKQLAFHVLPRAIIFIQHFSHKIIDPL